MPVLNFLKKRFELVKRYVQIQEMDHRLDCFADGKSYDPNAVQIWKQYPEIDIFNTDEFGPRLQKLIKSTQAKKKKESVVSNAILEKWERLVLEYCLNQKRWWSSCIHGLDPHDDNLMIDADRRERETNEMMHEDQAAFIYRRNVSRMSAIRSKRERIQMVEEDRLSRMLRDQVIFFSFSATMSIRTDSIDPFKIIGEKNSARQSYQSSASSKSHHAIDSDHTSDANVELNAELKQVESKK